MHDIRRLGLQVFAAPDNLTGEVQVQVKAREIDFVTSFGKNLKALLDILGITRMIRKENNSVLKTKTVTRIFIINPLLEEKKKKKDKRG